MCHMINKWMGGVDSVLTVVLAALDTADLDVHSYYRMLIGLPNTGELKFCDFIAELHK